MTARVARGAADIICDYPDAFVLRVRGAADVDLALRALALARDDIAVLAEAADDPDGSMLSQPVLGPEGALLRVARLDADDDVLRTVPDLVVARLTELGVDDAVVDVPEPGGRLDQLDTCPSAVVLRLFPPPAGNGGTLPAAWIDIACEWVLGDLAAADRVPLRLVGIEYDVPVADAPAVVHQANLAGAWCDVVNGDLGDRVRTASITFGGAPHIALAAGGPACDGHALLARFELLCEVARELAIDVAYACIDLEPTFEGIGLGLASTGWRGHNGASPNVVAGELADVLVPDAFPYQIIGKGHHTRLHAEGPHFHEPPVAEPVAEGRFEIVIGEPLDWLPGQELRDEVQAEGWELLRPLLATERQLHEMLLARPGRQVLDEAAPPPGHSVGSGGSPDLDDIVLEAVPHARRGLRLTVLELVSWLAHEHHSDTPATTSPVIATYARWFGSALTDRRRQDLKGRARSMLGTAPAEPRSGVTRLALLSPPDIERAWVATDWLIRVQAVAWLRLADLTQAAARLESLGPVYDRVHLMRAVDVLGSAITIAARRLDLTASVAGGERPGDTDLVEQASWSAWERSSEAAGWVAASEAAAFGVPAEMAYATDLRVIECARDARMLGELEASRRSIGDLAWSAALHAMADEAWRLGWAAAHPAVDALAVLPLRTAFSRATRAVAERTGADDDEREQSTEAAEAVAKLVLTRTALGSATATSGTHPWDLALESAAAADGATLWADVHRVARAAVDEGPWAAGMAAARAAVDEILREGPDIVARAVGAAMAREAAGTSARGVALRAAAIARAQGGSEGDANRAASDALAHTAAKLQDAAFELLDTLIAGGPPRPPIAPARGRRA